MVIAIPVKAYGNDEGKKKNTNSHSETKEQNYLAQRIPSKACVGAPRIFHFDLLRD
jgi:hypothetical protein